MLSNSPLIIYAWEGFQAGLNFNPQTLLTRLSILPLTLEGKELLCQPNNLACPGARIFVLVGK